MSGYGSVRTSQSEGEVLYNLRQLHHGNSDGGGWGFGRSLEHRRLLPMAA